MPSSCTSAAGMSGVSGCGSGRSAAGGAGMGGCVRPTWAPDLVAGCGSGFGAGVCQVIGTNSSSETCYMPSSQDLYLQALSCVEN